jgi:hypothetical protein
MRNQISTITIINIIVLLLLNSCKKEELSQPVIYPTGPEAKLILSRLVTETYPPVVEGESVQYCPIFIFWNRPYHIGDTLAVLVSQEFGAQIIGNKDVFVTVTSKFGDSETYLLNNGFWPCQTIVADISIYKTVIYYNSKPLDRKAKAIPNNGELEIRTTGDTLIASYNSYSTGKMIYDTVAIIPK